MCLRYIFTNTIISVIFFYFFFFFFFKQKTAYEMLRSLVGSEMCIRDRYKHVVWHCIYQCNTNAIIAMCFRTVRCQQHGLSDPLQGHNSSNVWNWRLILRDSTWDY
eukprot:TRINITY_DN133_c0_g1_i21.p1 TRINITY_DN133_c0_g1~~TRINITY_DN133_c0_g1_i21.p1  ORF type:complete len:106 (+),score=21.99 TRINITY_DN133_c0_g1_i21:56-373(+)